MEPETVSLGSRPQLLEKERSQLHQSETTGQRFRDLDHERRGNGSEEQEPAFTRAVCVDRSAQSRKDRRPRLRLVEDDELRSGHPLIPFEVEPQAVGLLLQVVGDSAEGPGERRLAALARPDEGDRRRGLEALADEGFDLALNHPCILEVAFLICKNQVKTAENRADIG